MSICGKWLNGSGSSTKWKWKWLFSMKLNHLHRLDYNVVYARMHVIQSNEVWNWIESSLNALRIIPMPFTMARHKHTRIQCVQCATGWYTFKWMVELIMRNIIIFISQDAPKHGLTVRETVKSLCTRYSWHTRSEKVEMAINVLACYTIKCMHNQLMQTGWKHFVCEENEKRLFVMCTDPDCL